MQRTRKHLESDFQSCSRSTSQRLGLVKTVAGIGTKPSQSYNRRLDFIAMTAVKVGEERPEEAQDGFSDCSQKKMEGRCQQNSILSSNFAKRFFLWLQKNKRVIFKENFHILHIFYVI